MNVKFAYLYILLLYSLYILTSQIGEQITEMFQKKAKSDVGFFVPVLQVSEKKRNKNFNLSTPLVAHDTILGFLMLVL